MLMTSSVGKEKKAAEMSRVKSSLFWKEDGSQSVFALLICRAVQVHLAAQAGSGFYPSNAVPWERSFWRLRNA